MAWFCRKNYNKNQSILSKEYIESLGYEVEEVDYRIFLIKEFLTEDERQQLLDIAKSASQEEWEKHYMTGVLQMARVKFGREDIDNLVKEGLYEITTNWMDKTLYIEDEALRTQIGERAQKIFNFRDDLLFNGCGTIQRQYEGVPLVDHVDDHTDNSLMYAAVFYLNDDYTDGEVYFVNQGISLRPPIRSILVFPTSDGWRHGVKEVGAGPHRYIIPGFISQKDFWKNHRENNYNIEKTLKDAGR
jgi:hypothetical protein